MNVHVNFIHIHIHGDIYCDIQSDMFAYEVASISRLLKIKVSFAGYCLFYRALLLFYRALLQ